MGASPFNLILLESMENLFDWMVVFDIYINESTSERLPELFRPRMITGVF